MNASRKGRKGRKERQELCVQTGMGLLRQSVRDAFDSVPEMNFTKVNQQPQSIAGEAQLSENLFAMNRRELFHGLQLHDELVLNNQIGAKALFDLKFVPQSHLQL